MRIRLVTVFVLVTTTLIILVSLSGTSLRVTLVQAATTVPSPGSPLAASNKTADIEKQRSNITEVSPNSRAALTATNVTTTYIFLPLIIRSPSRDLGSFAASVVNETNTYRIQHGCPPLILSAQLSDAAQSHSEDMALSDFFSHTSSDGSTPWERIERTGYRYSLAAENIAAGYTTPEAVVQGWMNSAYHRENILDCNLREIGVGYYYQKDDNGTANYCHYWTQVLATPK